MRKLFLTLSLDILQLYYHSIYIGSKQDGYSKENIQAATPFRAMSDHFGWNVEISEGSGIFYRQNTI